MKLNNGKKNTSNWKVIDRTPESNEQKTDNERIRADTLFKTYSEQEKGSGEMKRKKKKRKKTVCSRKFGECHF